MALSPAQTKLYWRTWASIAALLQADLPEASKKDVASQRHGQHKAASCPASMTTWGNQDLTRWLCWARVVADPLDLQARIDFEEASHPEAARISQIRRLLLQLGKLPAYAAGCANDPTLPADFCKWPASSLQTALFALSRTARRSQVPGKTPPPA